MGIPLHVKGFKPPGEKWEQMKAVYDTCLDAGIGIPREVVAYLADTDPDPGVEISERDLMKAGALRGWHDDYGDGFELDVVKLPAGVTVIRFYNSW